MTHPYLLLDMDRVAVLHKHPNHSVVSKLGWIESSGSAIRVLQFDGVKALTYFTDLELAKLFESTTGVKPHIRGRNFLLGAVSDLLARLPITDAAPFEVDRQAAFIKADDETKYRYAKGAFVPQIADDLFEPAVLTAPRSEAAELAAQQSYSTAHATPTAYPTASAQHPAKGVAPPATKTAAPKGGVREVVFGIADSIWEQAGKPTSKPVVLALRKRMMDVLESQHGVKRTTCSTTLGDWMKSRVP